MTSIRRAHVIAKLSFLVSRATRPSCSRGCPGRHSACQHTLDCQTPITDLVASVDRSPGHEVGLVEVHHKSVSEALCEVQQYELGAMLLCFRSLWIASLIGGWDSPGYSSQTTFVAMLALGKLWHVQTVPVTHGGRRVAEVTQRNEDPQNDSLCNVINFASNCPSSIHDVIESLQPKRH